MKKRGHDFLQKNKEGIWEGWGEGNDVIIISKKKRNNKKIKTKELALSLLAQKLCYPEWCRLHGEMRCRTLNFTKLLRAQRQS